MNVLCWALELWIVVVEPFVTPPELPSQLNVIGDIAVLLVSVTFLKAGDNEGPPTKNCSSSSLRTGFWSFIESLNPYNEPACVISNMRVVRRRALACVGARMSRRNLSEIYASRSAFLM